MNHKSAITVERVRVLYERAFPGIITEIVGAFIFAYIFREQITSPVLLVWLGFMSIIALLRYWLIVDYNKTKALTPHHDKFEKRYTYATGLAGIGWAFFIVSALYLPVFEYRIYSLLLLVGIVALAVPMLSTSIKTLYFYIAPSVMIVIPLLMFRGGNNTAIGLALFVFIMMVIHSSKDSYKTLNDTLNLRFKTQEQTRSLEQLLESKKRAEAASDSKSIFLANMSHEIRTPLSGVIGLSNLLLDTKQTDEQRELTESVLTSSESLLCLINDILDFSKIEAGKLDIVDKDFNLRITIKSIMDMLSLQAKEKRLNLTCSIDPQLDCFLIGDEGRLRQILINLVNNAIKFTNMGDIDVSCVLEQETSSNSIVRFSIRDTGIGLSRNEIDKIFNPFIQADLSSTRNYGGTGLGLSIVKILVELMGGGISVTSNGGKGAVFTFTVKLKQQPLDSPQRTGSSTNTKRNTRGEFNARVLVAEDNPVNLKIIVKMLEKMGCQTDAVTNGLEAVEAVKNCSYNLVLMDCNMPKMDGYEATKAIRHWQVESSCFDINIVALTANALTGDKELCLNAGMNDHIAKPITSDELRRVLEHYAVPQDTSSL